MTMDSENIFGGIKDRLKLIIFDLDGTLVDSSKPMRDALNYTLAKLKLTQYTQAEADALIGVPLGNVFMKLLNRTVRDSQIDQCIEIYREKYKEICCRDSLLYDGVMALLPDLAANYKLALATTKRSDVARMTLDHFGLIHYFALIKGFDHVKNPKPEPEIILKILTELDIKPYEALMVGDSNYDLRAAKAALVRVCIVTYGFDKIDNWRDLHPEFMIDRFDQLRGLI